MSDHAAVTSAPPRGLRALFPIHRSWKFAAAVALVMVLLALLGIGLTTTNRAYAQQYWMWLVPVFGLLCVATAWSRGTEIGRRDLVVRQILHWLGIAAALGIDFVISGTGEETRLAAGFNALLLLALGCFLAGVHFEWLFTVVGLLLTAALLVAVRADQYLWLMLLAGAVVAAAIVGVMWAVAKSRGPNAGPAPVGSAKS
jgi:hypothetical protein